MTEKQRDLLEKHGTPEDFESVVWTACCNLFVTREEAIAAIHKYRQEWTEAEVDEPILCSCGKPMQVGSFTDGKLDWAECHECYVKRVLVDNVVTVPGISYTFNVEGDECR